MNATSIAELRNGLADRDLHDERMQQIRELLFGDQQRLTEERLARLESRVRELESTIERRIDALQARIEALAGEVGASQRTTLEELSQGMQDLGDRIRRMARD